MNKRIWIINHYAGVTFFDKGGRHYWIAKYLKQNGYEPIVICSNAKHNSNEELYYNIQSLFHVQTADEIDVPFVFVASRPYSDNGKKRILNMVDFYRNVQKISGKLANLYGTPDIIYASSVHPLTLVAGIKLAKYYGVKCISEVRDLWPESIVAYSSRWTRNNPIMRVLYAGEKWIYKKSDYVIMTWAGGYDYIRDQGWQNDIPEKKVVHISNGVDLEPYLRNIQEHPYEDADLSNRDYKNFIYTGSIKKVNNLSLLVSAAQELKKMGNSTARILVFGNGDELESLKQDAEKRKLDNILFKGSVPKQKIPSILSQAYASILHNSSTELNKYGQSQNKFFEYLAAGRPILMTYSVGHSVVKSQRCGIELDEQSPKAIADAILRLSNVTEEEYLQYCHNASECAKQFDFKKLTDDLIEIIKQCI